MLLNTGNLNVQELLGGDPSGKKITHIGVGTSSTPVAATDTTLTGMVTKAVADVNYLPGGVVQFHATLEGADPAMSINEIGLLNEDGELLFRKVITTREKVAGLSYALTYKIKVQ